MALELKVNDEVSSLETVILGIGESLGKPRLINPKAKYHFDRGTYPKEADIIQEINGFKTVLENNGIKVLRPHNYDDTMQIFTRDIGFVIDDYFIKANMKEPSRQKEIDAIEDIITLMDYSKVLTPPHEVTIEGGDVMLWNEYVFVGKSRRTNDAAYHYIKDKFPFKEVVQIEVVSSNDPKENVLHLDCAFQPVGKEFAILYEPGLKNPDVIINIFRRKNLPEENFIKVSQQEAYDMFPNILSIANKTVIIEKSFAALRSNLQKRVYGY